MITVVETVLEEAVSVLGYRDGFRAVEWVHHALIAPPGSVESVAAWWSFERSTAYRRSRLPDRVWPDVEYLEDVVSAETLEWCEILGASIGHLDPVDRRSLWGSELDVLQFGLVASAVV